MERTLTSPLTCYYDLELPPNHARRRKWPVLIGTHGYEGNKESMMRLVLRIAGEKMIAASMQGPYQFWLPPADGDARNRRVVFGWGTDYKGLDSVAWHHHSMRQLISTLVRDHCADPDRVFLVAFSQS